jgi:hypothetical protein
MTCATFSFALLQNEAISNDVHCVRVRLPVPFLGSKPPGCYLRRPALLLYLSVKKVLTLLSMLSSSCKKMCNVFALLTSTIAAVFRKH